MKALTILVLFCSLLTTSMAHSEENDPSYFDWRTSPVTAAEVFEGLSSTDPVARGQAVSRLTIQGDLVIPAISIELSKDNLPPQEIFGLILAMTYMSKVEGKIIKSLLAPKALANIKKCLDAYRTESQDHAQIAISTGHPFYQKLGMVEAQY